MDPVIFYSRQMVKEGLTFSTGGNISRRLDPDHYLITPSGQDYETMEDKDLVKMDLLGQVLEGSNPSSEYQLHQEIYGAYDEAQAVVHTHSEYINILSILDQPLDTIHYLMADGGPDPIQVAPYASFGTKALADQALESFGRNKAVILSHHGLVCYGASVKEAFKLAQTLEFCAKIYVKALAIARPSPLDKEEMEAMVRRFKSYGK